MKVVQVVPRLFPPAEGVGSFAETLARGLSRLGITSRFVVGDPTWPGQAGSSMQAETVPRRTAEGLATALEAGEEEAVVLHYAGYGYQPRGCPAWLVEGLNRWRAGTPQRRLVTAFHEVYANGPPWRSSFWLNGRQRRLAQALASASFGVVTSLEIYRRRLAQWTSGCKVTVLPVFSAVGEPDAIAPLVDRVRRLVLFGSTGARQRAYHEMRDRLAATCRILDLDEIWEVGHPDGIEPSRLPVRVRRLGHLQDAEVSALLAESVAGFVAYPAPFLAKSTIFAAYCAHGLLPVSTWPRPRRRLQEPPPFWRPGRGAPLAGLEELQPIADHAYAWYRGHSLARHVATYCGMLAA
jgi:hypothetical protein